jgi:hypothetical protein
MLAHTSLRGRTAEPQDSSFFESKVGQRSVRSSITRSFGGARPLPRPV